MTDETEQQPDSLLPYDRWTDEAMRHVMLRALAYAAANGLPGEHHFYLTFRTGMAGVEIPDRLRAQYPNEMTIVLQHQFWDLTVDDARRIVSVGLSFGGIPSMLRIPFGAVTQFFDPHVRFGLRFEPDDVDTAPLADAAKPFALVAVPSEPEKTDLIPEQRKAPLTQDDEAGPAAPKAEPETTAGTEPDKPAEEAQVVSLDAFRRRPPPRET